jgi:membrane-bound metal-dependent hydrolase YbcI (DUF457 family)
MNWNGHKNGGIFTTIIMMGVFIYLGISVSDVIILGTISFLFSLYPDTDINSTSGKVFFVVAIPITLFLLVNNPYMGIVILPILIAPILSHHRGITHSIVWLAVTAGSISYIVLKTTGIELHYSMIAVSVGYFTHLLLDTHFKIL